MHLSGLIALLIALYVSFVNGLCVYMSICVLCWPMGLFVSVYMCFWSFIHVYFVTNFLFVTALLLMHYSALCVLCNSYLLSMTMCILIILVPFSL